MQSSSPSDWAIFASEAGSRVLRELQERFASGTLYVQGGQDAERQTLANAACRDVLDYIVRRVQSSAEPEQTPDIPKVSHDL